MKIMNEAIRFLVACLSAAFCLSGCGSNTATPADASAAMAFGDIYRIADDPQLPGWNPDPSTPLWTGTGPELSAIIPGDNVPYLQRGCLLAMYQRLTGTESQRCRLVAMEFGASVNATAMFTYEQQLSSVAVSIPGYDASTALAYAVDGGIHAHAHLQSLYFEVQLNGYPDAPSAAQVAAQFLDVMWARTR